MRRLITLVLPALIATGPAFALTDDFQRIDPKAAHILEGIDWQTATSVEVDLADHDFAPSEMVLERGRPYILTLHNVGAQAHDMVGGSFFQAIVVRMANTPSGRIVTPYLKSIYVRSQQRIEIWFVPTRAGKFSFFCSLPGHRDAGMEGTVEIR